MVTGLGAPELHQLDRLVAAATAPRAHSLELSWGAAAYYWRTMREWDDKLLSLTGGERKKRIKPPRKTTTTANFQCAYVCAYVVW